MKNIRIRNDSVSTIFLSCLGSQRILPNEVLTLSKKDVDNVSDLLELENLIISSDISILDKKGGTYDTDTALNVIRGVSEGDATAGSLNSQIISSNSYTSVEGMQITPDAGTYISIFSATAFVSVSNKIIDYGIFINDVLIPDSRRRVSLPNKDHYISLYAQSMLNIESADIITVKAKIEEYSLTVYERSLLLFEA